MPHYDRKPMKGEPGFGIPGAFVRVLTGPEGLELGAVPSHVPGNAERSPSDFVRDFDAIAAGEEDVLRPTTRKDRQGMGGRHRAARSAREAAGE